MRPDTGLDFAPALRAAALVYARPFPRARPFDSRRPELRTTQARSHELSPVFLGAVSDTKPVMWPSRRKIFLLHLRVSKRSFITKAFFNF